MTTATPLAGKVRFIARYKPEHPWAGEEVERGYRCDCGRWFPQWIVSQAFLESLPQDRRKAFLESCEVVKYRKGEAAWFPKQCRHCERRHIETFYVLEKYA